MSRRVPISLIIDDSCPLVHVFVHIRRDVHKRPLVTADGRPMPLWIPNAFLDRFCDTAERWGMAGKFSIVPEPGGVGDIVHGIAGQPAQLTRDWLETVRSRLSARWDFCPEGLTHNLAVDLQSGEFLPESENAWSQRQNRSTLTPYLERGLRRLKEAGFDATGVTSPWEFGRQVEGEYQAAIVEAQRRVYGRSVSWYFLHMSRERPGYPWIALQEGESTLVHVPGAIDDLWWETIESPRTDAEYVREVADRFLTPDGAAGEIRRVLNQNGWPILLTHWQSLFSSGLETGLAILDEVGRRVSHSLANEVEWCSFSEIVDRFLQEEQATPQPRSSEPA